MLMSVHCSQPVCYAKWAATTSSDQHHYHHHHYIIITRQCFRCSGCWWRRDATAGRRPSSSLFLDLPANRTCQPRPRSAETSASKYQPGDWLTGCRVVHGTPVRWPPTARWPLPGDYLVPGDSVVQFGGPDPLSSSANLVSGDHLVANGGHQNCLKRLLTLSCAWWLPHSVPFDDLVPGHSVISVRWPPSGYVVRGPSTMTTYCPATSAYFAAGDYRRFGGMITYWSGDNLVPDDWLPNRYQPGDWRPH